MTWLKDSGTSTWQPCQHSFHPFHPGVLTCVVTTTPDVEKVSSAQYRAVFFSQTQRKSRNRTSIRLNISSRGAAIALRSIFMGMCSSAAQHNIFTRKRHLLEEPRAMIQNTSNTSLDRRGCSSGTLRTHGHELAFLLANLGLAFVWRTQSSYVQTLKWRFSQPKGSSSRQGTHLTCQNAHMQIDTHERSKHLSFVVLNLAARRCKAHSRTCSVNASGLSC